MDVYDVMEQMMEEGYSQEEAQFIAADRCFGEIGYNEAINAQAY